MKPSHHSAFNNSLPAMDWRGGPKAWLSSAIAEALAEYFVVSLDNIESNLWINPKIVLKDARLKPQVSSIPNNTFGKTTRICFTGFVRKVIFSWRWDFLASDSKSWIKDAVLEIHGCRFTMRLNQDDAGATNVGGDDHASDPVPNMDVDADSTRDESQTAALEDQIKLDPPMAEIRTIEDEICAYLTRQLGLFVDALTLTVVDFEWTIEMPSPTLFDSPRKIPDVSVFEDPQEAGNIEIVQLEKLRTSSSTTSEAKHSRDKQQDYTIALKIGVQKVDILSYGRHHYSNDEYLKEIISISSLFLNVTETFHETIPAIGDSTRRREVVCKTYPLLEAFSYALAITRTEGKRFGDIGRGLEVKGGQYSSFGEDAKMATKHENNVGGLSFYFSRPQMEAIGQLSGLILAPPEAATSKETAMEGRKPINDKVSTNLVGDASIFGFSLDGATADIMGNTLVATGIHINCVADGSDLSAKIDQLRYSEVDSEHRSRGTCIRISNVVASVWPCVEVTIGSVSELYVPLVVELKTPINDIQARLIGQTLALNADSFDGSLPAPESEMVNNLPQCKDATRIHSEHSSTRDPDFVSEDVNSSTDGTFVVLFPVSCKVQHVCLVKEDDDETKVTFTDVEILLNPEPDGSGTDLACYIGDMKSKLANAKDINTCMIIPADKRDADTIRNFALSLDSLSVTAGYTIQDWIKTFRIGGKWKSMQNKIGESSNEQPTYLNLPYASVAPLKTRITYNAMNVVSLKETTFLVNAFKGKDSTTTKQLIDFYAAECIARTPDFLQNAELLGINVEKASAFSLGTTLGLSGPIGPLVGPIGPHIGPLAGPLAGPIGPLVGVAAVVGVDAVRGSIEAGKRGRHAKEGESATFGDFFRGIGYSAVEATQRGKIRRGCENGRGNVIDWVVGATFNTGDYIGKNKDTLGSAGGAGAGVLVGTMLGGPVGAVIGGVVGGMTTGTAIRRIDKRIENAIETKES